MKAAVMQETAARENISVLDLVREIISDVTFIELADIHPLSDLVIDLEITAEAGNLNEIVTRINKTFHIILNPKRVALEAETVGDIVDLINDEIDY